jgi:dinuclear metal center YbgI/SA1388 family protein
VRACDIASEPRVCSWDRTPVFTQPRTSLRVAFQRMSDRVTSTYKIAMPTVAAIAAFLEQVAPFRLAEDWDNVGLLVGHRGQNVKKLITCLTVTPETAAEAVEAGADLIVTHHPMPFLATKRLTDETTAGRLLLELIVAQVAVYSPHTAFDSAAEGVNQRLATGLGLRGIGPLLPHVEGQGTGRWGSLQEPISLAELADRLKRFLKIERLQMVGRPERSIRTVAVGCGAADELLDSARSNGCDAMVLGEARFHTCLEARAAGIALLLSGHFASERFAVEGLAEVLARQFPEAEIWASRRESDPIEWR